MIPARSSVTELTQPWFDDPYPELWVTATELTLLLGLSDDNMTRPKVIDEHCERFGIRVWKSSVRPQARGRCFYRMNISDLDSIRLVRKRRIQEGHRPNPIEEYIARFKSVTPFSLP